ncbi:MAG: hypothetical protein ABIN45_05230 [Gammaproteobacteria bacterium]
MPPPEVQGRTNVAGGTTPGMEEVESRQEQRSRTPGAAATLTVHGVLMEICGIGVLIRGPSGIGKGDLALELISRGQRLIADDAPLLSRASQLLSGDCSPLLRNLLEVRDLGVLNIAVLFGEQTTASSTLLQLIVTLDMVAAEPETAERGIAGPTYCTCRLLDVEVPEVRLALRTGRPTALLVETLVKNFKLQQQGYFSHADLSERQRRVMTQSPQ